MLFGNELENMTSRRQDWESTGYPGVAVFHPVADFFLFFWTSDTIV